MKYSEIRTFTTWYVNCPECDVEVFSTTDAQDVADDQEFECYACETKFIATSDMSQAEPDETPN